MGGRQGLFSCGFFFVPRDSRAMRTMETVSCLRYLPAQSEQRCISFVGVGGAGGDFLM